MAKRVRLRTALKRGFQDARSRKGAPGKDQTVFVRTDADERAEAHKKADHRGGRQPRQQYPRVIFRLFREKKSGNGRKDQEDGDVVEKGIDPFSQGAGPAKAWIRIIAQKMIQKRRLAALREPERVASEGALVKTCGPIHQGDERQEAEYRSREKKRLREARKSGLKSI